MSLDIDVGEVFARAKVTRIEVEILTSLLNLKDKDEALAMLSRLIGIIQHAKPGRSGD